MSRRKRAYLLPLSAVALAALGGFLYFVLPRDEDSPADGDLRPVRRQIPDALNGFLVLNACFDRIDLPPETSKARDPSGKDWDPRIAEETTARNAAVLEALDESLRYQAWQVPEAYHTNSQKCRGCGQVSELAAIRIRLLFDGGSEREAFDRAFQLLDYGHRLQGAGGAPFQQGSGAMGRALRAMEGMVATTKLPRGELAGFLDGLERFQFNEEGWRETVKIIYRHSCEFIDNLPDARDRSWIARVNLKPNRTKRMLAGVTRRILRGEDARPDEAGRGWWPPINMVGKEICSAHASIIAGYRERLRHQQLLISALREKFARKS